MATNSRDKYSATGMTANVGSATHVFKAGGENMAVCFPLAKIGYKHPGAYGARPVFNAESTNTFYQKQVLAAGKYTGTHKKLEPYRPNAPRNRPKETLVNIVGTRHKLHPCIKHETYRGSSKVKLTDGNIESTKPWKTVNQVFAECTQVRNTVGLANQGISADVARRLHKRQEIYSP